MGYEEDRARREEERKKEQEQRALDNKILQAKIKGQEVEPIENPETGKAELMVHLEKDETPAEVFDSPKGKPIMKQRVCYECNEKLFKNNAKYIPEEDNWFCTECYDYFTKEEEEVEEEPVKTKSKTHYKSPNIGKYIPVMTFIWLAVLLVFTNFFDGGVLGIPETLFAYGLIAFGLFSVFHLFLSSGGDGFSIITVMITIFIMVYMLYFIGSGFGSLMVFR